ncbi:MAG: mobile mystery protein A [Burkholderiales bacterium]|nr:mobile mystery protein A [Burkholderiales bacterium]
MSWEKELKLKQVDEMISKLKTNNVIKPKNGWIYLIRKTLGMSTRVLAERIGLAQSRVALIEKGEVNETITLHTLKKVAEGLECDFIYFLVPKDGSLAKLREKQAYKNAVHVDTYAEKHMNLEAQGTSIDYQKESVEKLKETYIKSWSRNFWNKK